MNESDWRKSTAPLGNGTFSVLRPLFSSRREVERAGELEGRVGRGYRGVTTRPSKGDIVLHTALLFYASRRPSFL